MNEVKYTKLSEVGEFTYINYVNHAFKKWDTEQKKMLSVQRPEAGYSLKYTVKTDKGLLDLSESQLSTMLGKVFNRIDRERSDLRNAKFAVKTNGKTGMELRYFFNFLGYQDEVIQVENYDAPVEEISIEDIPFN